MGRVSDTLRDALLKCFTSKRNSDSLICQSMDIVKLNFIDLFKSMCPLMNIDSGSTLKIEIISDEISESVCQERPNFLESLLDSKIEVNTVKNFRWKKRSLKGESSPSQKWSLKGPCHENILPSSAKSPN